MSIFEQQLKEMQERTRALGVDSSMVMASPVSENLFGIEKPQHWTEKAMEEDGSMKFFGKMLLGGFTGLTPLLFPEMIGSKARYANDLDIYKDQLEHAREQSVRQKYVDVLMDPNATHQERMAAAAMAGGISEFDPNPITASPGAAILGAGTGQVIHNQPNKPPVDPAAVLEARSTAGPIGMPEDDPLFAKLIAAYAEPTETRTAEDGSTYTVNTVNEVLKLWEQQQQANQQLATEQAAPSSAPAQQRDDPATQGPMVTGINKKQAELVQGAPEKLKFYRQFGEVLDGLGKWDPVKKEFVLNEDVTDLYGSWDGNPLNPQNWNGFGDDGDAGGFGGGTELFMPEGNRNSKAGIEQLINMLTVDERGKLKGQGQITEGETAMLRAAVTSAAKRGMGDSAAQREFTRLYNEYIKSMTEQQKLLERYWSDHPYLTNGSESNIINLDQ